VVTIKRALSFTRPTKNKIKYVVTIKCGRTERHYFLVDRVTEVTMDEACEPETKQGNTYRVLVDLKALSRSIKESTEPKHRVQRYHAASVLRKASDSTDHMLELGPFDQKEYSGKPLGRRVGCKLSVGSTGRPRPEQTRGTSTL
jgi:hypothetical protein